MRSLARTALPARDVEDQVPPGGAGQLQGGGGSVGKQLAEGVGRLLCARCGVHPGDLDAGHAEPGLVSGPAEGVVQVRGRHDERHREPLVGGDQLDQLGHRACGQDQGTDELGERAPQEVVRDHGLRERRLAGGEHRGVVEQPVDQPVRRGHAAGPRPVHDQA